MCSSRFFVHFKDCQQEIVCIVRNLFSVYQVSTSWNRSAFGNLTNSGMQRYINPTIPLAAPDPALPPRLYPFGPNACTIAFSSFCEYIIKKTRVKWLYFYLKTGLINEDGSEKGNK
jgi:hypothetical protein